MCPSSATAQTFQLFLPIGHQINLKITLLLINFIVGKFVIQLVLCFDRS